MAALGETDMPTVREQAQVATVLYDMILKGVPQDDELFMRLSATYPASAALAYQFVTRARATLSEALPTGQTEPAQAPVIPHAPLRRGVLVLERVSIRSCAKVFALLGLLCTLSQMLFVLMLAVGTTLSYDKSPELAAFLREVAETAVGSGQGLEVYKWVLAIVKQWLLGEAAQNKLPPHVSPALAVQVALVMPLIVSALCFIIGSVAAYVVNVALAITGGARVHHRQD